MHTTRHVRRATRRAALLPAVAVGALVATASLSGAPASASPTTAGPTAGAVDPRPWVDGDRTVPVFALEDAISEQIEVVTSIDGDQDGEPDRIFVDLLRPDTDEPVPLIVRASPYYGLGPRGWEPAYFVPRGYAVAKVSMPGTDRATGCDDVGGRLEVVGTKAVVQWANGRADGFDAGTDDPNEATWSTGKVGMIGKSWDGTIANAVASTGVKGLETVVPVAAISSWYDYTRGNGIPFYAGHVASLHRYVSNFDSAYCRTLTGTLQAAADDTSGSYNGWWRERDYRPDASKIKASVFVVHGLADENVKTDQFGVWWDELVEHDVERRLFLSQGEHIDPYDEFGTTYTNPLNAWFDYYLQGLDNGVEDEPQAIIQREDGSWSTDEQWPPVGTEPRRMKLSKPLGREAGAITLDGATSTATPTSAVKRVRFAQAAPYSSDSVVANPTAPRTDRAVFLSAALDEQLRQAGSATVRLRVMVNREAAGFQARVVDYGPDGSAYIVSRTIADLGHHRSLEEKDVLQPGKFYTLEWEINTDDRVFAEGHRLGLVITAEKHNPGAAYEPVTATIKTARSWLTLPVVGELATSLGSVGTDVEVITTTVSPGGPPRDADAAVRELLGIG